MRTPRSGTLAALLALGATLSFAADKTADKAVAKPLASPVLAVLDGQNISEADLEEVGGTRLFQARSQLYTLQRQLVDELIAKRVAEREAKARGLSVEALFKAEVEDKVPPLSEDEKRAFYESNKARFGSMAEADAMKQIADNLPRQRVNERRQAYFVELRAKAAVKVLLEPPRVAVDPSDDPSKGPSNAPVTLVLFSDFQCPFCARVVPTLHRLEDTYKDKLRIVFRDMPLLQIHKDAAKAAEAASCAAEQGKFWEMHDKMFENQNALQVAELKKSAATLGLDSAAFDGCLDSGKYVAEWQKDSADAQRYGVAGTPAAFVNGRFLSGAQPYESFAQIIDEELELTAAKEPKSTKAKAGSSTK